MSVSVEDFTALKQELEGVKAQAQKNLENEIKSYKDKAVALEDSSKQLRVDLDALKATIKAKDDKITELDGLIVKANEALAKASKELSDIQAMAKSNKRLTDLSKTNLDDVKKNKLVADFVGASDEAWSGLVDSLPTGKASGAQKTAGTDINDKSNSNGSGPVVDEVNSENVTKLRAWLESSVFKGEKK